MKDFAYYAPTTLAEASVLMGQHTGKAKVLAGGTDLIVQLREGLREADAVVDVKRIPEFMELIYSTATGLKLGACTPCYRVYEHADLKQAYAALVDSAHIIGGWQIQSRASIGGNLCNASPAADSIPSLIVLNATALVHTSHGSKRVAVRDFCVSPGKNCLQLGEMLVSLEFPACSANSGSAYERFIPRNEMDIAVVGAAAWIQLNAAQNVIEDCRIALGAVGPTPKFCEAASRSVIGQTPSEALFAAAGDLAKQDATPITDLRGTAEFRTHLVGVLVKRTLLKAVERAQSLSGNS